MDCANYDVWAKKHDILRTYIQSGGSLNMRKINASPRAHFIQSKSILGIFVILTATLLNSATFAKDNMNYKLVKEKREVSDFNQVSVSGKGQLFIKQDKRPSLQIEAEANVLPKIKSEVNDQQLNLGSIDPSLAIESPIKYYLTVKDLKKLNCSGNFEIITQDAIVADNLEVVLSGSGKASFKLNKVKIFVLNTSGAYQVSAEGEALEQTINTAGSAEYNAKKLKSKKANIHLAGAGSAIVNASDELDIKIQGSGNVTYYGSPKITQETSGGGDIIPAN